jgi:hypothetical protein
MNIDRSKIVNKAQKDAKKREETIATIASKRWLAETAGISVNGLSVYTDRTTQMKLTAATLRATRDPDYTVDWKTTSGTFINMTADQIITIGDVIGDYVQACYTREGEIMSALNDNMFTDNMLDEGWPAREY